MARANTFFYFYFFYTGVVDGGGVKPVASLCYQDEEGGHLEGKGLHSKGLTDTLNDD